MSLIGMLICEAIALVCANILELWGCNYSKVKWWTIMGVAIISIVWFAVFCYIFFTAEAN